MDVSLEKHLNSFASTVPGGKGALSVFLVVTEHARDNGLPLDPESLLAEGKGQVRGLGRARVQKILERHGITQTLAQEGGRTSRRSLLHMQAYVRFLNGLDENDLVDLNAIETFWIRKVQELLAAKPFRLKLSSEGSLRSVVRDLFAQASKRQKTASGRTDTGAVLQHLVGAKIDCALGEHIDHYSYSTADAPTSRSGDFVLSDTTVHVTTAPSENVIGRCRENLQAGLRPILITLADEVPAAYSLARQQGIHEQVDILDIEQFVVLNLYEWSRFEVGDRRDTFQKLVLRYNDIVEEVETDPGLKIELR